MATTGLRDLQAALRQVSDTVEAAATRAVRDEAADIVADQKRIVPVVTGELRDGIETRRNRSKKGPTSTVGIWDQKLWWAIFIEWGRANAAPHPFVTPSVEQARRRFPARMRSEVVKALR